MRKEMIRTALVIPVVCILTAAGAHAAQAPSTAQKRTYVWFGELAGVNEAARTVIVKAQIPDHVVKYVDRFKMGDRVMLVWNMIGKKQAQTVIALWDMKGVSSGYVLPIEFVSADTQGKTITFNMRVPEKNLAVLKGAKPGQWIRVTSPTDQPGPDAAITSIEFSEKPPPDPEPKPEPKPELKKEAAKPADKPADKPAPKPEPKPEPTKPAPKKEPTAKPEAPA